MGTQITPMLAVSDGKAAMEFYKAAFGATVLWDLDGQVAGLEIDGAPFFLAEEAPEYGTRGPASAGFTTVRIELFVDDPVAVHRKALAAGARERDEGAAADPADAPRRGAGSVWASVADREVPGVARKAELGEEQKAGSGRTGDRNSIDTLTAECGRKYQRRATAQKCGKKRRGPLRLPIYLAYAG